MLKKWRGKARSIASGGWNKFRVFWLPLSVRQKLRYGGIGLAAVVVVVAAAALGINQLSNRPKLGKPLPTPEQAMQSNLNDLEKSPPKDSDNGKQKADYYMRLSVAYSDDKNYSAAAKALADRAAADPASMTYTDYIQQAIYYHGAKQDAAALKALDNATMAMPATDNPDNGYYRDLAQRSIDQLRKEYGV